MAHGSKHMGLSNIHASERYGNIASIANDTITQKFKRNISRSTGMMPKEASATLVLAWVHGCKGMPEIQNPIVTIKAFLRVARSGNIGPEALGLAWSDRKEEILQQ